MLKIEYSARFKKDYKRALRLGCQRALLVEVVNMLAEEKPLPVKYHDHMLRNTNVYKNVRECHIQPDWLLIYQIRNEKLSLYLLRTGTHSDLLGE